MQRFCLLLALALGLAVPAAHAARTADRAGLAAGDGSLSIGGTTPTSGATGSIVLAGRGVVWGYVAAGAITIYSYRTDGRSVPTVSGGKMQLSSDATSVIYTGSNMRFLLPGGRYRIEIDGSGIDVSAVGNGDVLSASGTGSLTADSNPFALGRVPLQASWGGDDNDNGNGNGVAAGTRNTFDFVGARVDNAGGSSH